MSKPDIYDGTHNATGMDNFLFRLDQYFDVISVQDEALQVGTTPPIFETLHNYGGFGSIVRLAKAFTPSILGLTLSKNSKSNLP